MTPGDTQYQIDLLGKVAEHIQKVADDRLRPDADLLLAAAQDGIKYMRWRLAQ